MVDAAEIEPTLSAIRFALMGHQALNILLTHIGFTSGPRGCKSGFTDAVEMALEEQLITRKEANYLLN